jgi:hypothetical protein
MLCQSLGCEFTSLVMRGNAVDFPPELSLIADQEKCDIVIMPWDESDYTRKLFWGNIHTLNQPIALVISTLDEMAPFRPRSSTLDEMSLQPRSLSFGSSSKSNSKKTKKEDADDSYYHEVFNEFQRSVPGKKPVSSVFALITGKLTDMHILQILSRFLAHNSIRIQILITGNARSFPESVKTAIANFTRKFGTLTNVTINKTASGPHAISQFITTILSKIGQTPFDYCIHSYIKPKPALQSTLTSPPRRLMGKAASHALLGFLNLIRPSEPSFVEKNLRLGVPPRLAEVENCYPALGDLGTSLMESAVALNVMILHEPHHDDAEYDMDTLKKAEVNSFRKLSANTFEPSQEVIQMSNGESPEEMAPNSEIETIPV